MSRPSRLPPQATESEDVEAYRHAIRAGQAGRYRYVSLIGLRVQDPIRIFKQLEKGLAFHALERFQKNTGLSRSDVTNVVVIKPRTLHRRKAQGRLDPEESDRLLRASRIFGKALELFEGNTDAARRWLSSPQAALGGERPITLAKTDVGAREVEALVGRLEHGVLT